MKAGQTLTQGDLQVALFPMEYLTITQGRDNKPTHVGIDAYDLAGKDTGKDKWYAPFDIEVVWLELNNNKTGVVVTNVKKVLLANGQVAEPRTIAIMLWHDDWIGGLAIGYQFKQGQYFYEEGMAGKATGNHIHMELSRYTRINNAYPFDVSPQGYLTVQGTALRIEDAFFINNTVILNDWGYKFKTYKAPVDNKPKPAPNNKDQILHVGEKFIFNKVYTANEIKQIGNVWALLDYELDAWINVAIVNRTDAQGNITASQWIELGDRFTIPGTYVVEKVDVAQDKVYPKGWGFGVKAKTLYEV